MMQNDNLTNVHEIIDRSSYLRGLLLLIKKDKNVWDHENSFFLAEGSSLGFDKEFSSSALKEVITNKYIDTSTPLFYNKTYAIRLLIRGIQMINQNEKAHPEEINFLLSVAAINGLSDKWAKRVIPNIFGKA